ncbi:hypothetical protein GLA29479_3587 [Lysobacter antibioticus]|nr:hypothetical protein GLA29479_3587 [Lysobacter antibioticus]
MVLVIPAGPQRRPSPLSSSSPGTRCRVGACRSGNGGFMKRAVR